ncbi:IS3 family transposase [Corynebacterium frankenforstense]
MIVGFIDDNRDEFEALPIVRALSATAARVAVSSYYANKKQQLSARARRDEALTEVIREVYEENYSCYGVHKMWKAINRDYADRLGHVARCTVERLMRRLDINGVRRKRKRPKTASACAEQCLEDLVERDFAAPASNRLWAADITYVPTRAGWV